MPGRGEVVIRIVGDASNLGRELNTAEGHVGRFSSRVSSIMRAASLALAGAGVVAVRFGIDAVSASRDLTEAVTRTNAIFGDSADAIHAWARGAARDMGLSTRAAENAVGTFGNIFVQLGSNTEQASELSTALTELATDFSSFHNADSEAVILAMTSAFRGEYDAVQRFVPTITAAAVEQRALEQTGKATNDMLTAQDRALATVALMMEGAGDAAGDFDRTSEGLANQQRILSAEFENAKARIGDELMPVIVALTSWLADNLPAAMDRVIHHIELTKLGWEELQRIIGEFRDKVVAYWQDVNRGWQVLVAEIKELTAPFIASLVAIRDAAVAFVGMFTQTWRDAAAAVDWAADRLLRLLDLIGLYNRSVPVKPLFDATAKPPLGVQTGFRQFHGGGIIPGSGEQWARVKGGEGVFTPEQMAALGGGGGGVTVNIYPAGYVMAEHDLVVTVRDALEKLNSYGG